MATTNLPASTSPSSFDSAGHSIGGTPARETLQELVNILALLASQDNKIRAAAETSLNDQWMTNTPDALLTGLTHITRHSQDTDLRSFSAVLTRRVAFKTIRNHPAATATTITSASTNASGTTNHSGNGNTEMTLWDVVQEGTRQMMKTHFLESMTKESNKSVRNKVCDTIAEMARRSLSTESTWPDLLPALLTCTKSEIPELRESALRIFSSIPHLVSGAGSGSNLQQIEVVKETFLRGLQDENPNVRLAALKAAGALLLETASQSRIRNTVAPLLAPMFDALNSMVVAKAEDLFNEGLLVLIELAEHTTRIFRTVLPLIVPFMATIIKNKTDFGEDRTRQSALELLLTIAECSPNLVRKAVPDFANILVPVALEMMCELEDDEVINADGKKEKCWWYLADDLDVDAQDENYSVGENAMDRLSRALGGKAILPVSFSIIPNMLGSDNWKARHAGLMAVSAIGEGCVKLMEVELTKIVLMVLPFLQDAHPRVRYAACNAIGQMSTDFAGIIQRDHHAVVLRTLIPVMDDEQFPRVRAHAAAALVNFCEAVEKNILEPYLDAIFERLLSLLRTGTTYVQEQAITTIATVADSAEDRFVKYYGGIMPMLMSVLREATDREYRLMRGKAMECASLIALAVGKEVFAPHAQEFIKLLVRTQTDVTETDDPQAAYLLAAWARICKVLGQDFVPYLDIVMPPLLASAQLKLDFAVLDPEDDVESKYSAEDGWEFVGVDGQQIGIKTTVLEEKCTALEMLICYARELGPGFRPYLERVRDLALPLLKFYFHDGVRHASAALLPQLISCAKQAELDPEYQINFWHQISARILEVMAAESDTAFLLQLYTSFYESVESMGPGSSLSPELLEAFTRATELQLKGYYQRLKHRDEARATLFGAQQPGTEDLSSLGGLAEEDLEALEEEETNEEAVLAEISKAMHSVLKTHGAACQGMMVLLEPVIASFLIERPAAETAGITVMTHATARQWAICVLDDVIEFTGPASYPILASYLPRLLESLLDPVADVRQAACYGVGLCGHVGGPDYADFCQAALPFLFQLINLPNARAQENVYVTENAISAVTKICRFNDSKFDRVAVLPSWIQSLPIVVDEDEASLTYEFLMDLIDTRHTSVLGLNNVNIPHLATVMLEALASGVLMSGNPALVSRLMNTVKAVLSSLDRTLQTTVLSSLTAEKQKTLQSMGLIF